MASGARVARAHTEYKTQRAVLRERLRLQLEAELLPYSRELGEAIVEMRNRGANITDIQDALGIQNKTFIYKMIRIGETKVTPRHKTEPVEEPTPETATKQYVIDYNDYGDATVTFDDGSQQFFHHDYLEIPDEWLGASDPIYKEIILEINNAVSGKD